MIDVMKKWYVILSVCTLFATLSSCVEELQTENFYTFTGETITDYVENRESLSMFKELLERTSEPNMLSLLDAYGQYTCFAPHNDAFKAYLEERGVSSVSELRPGECDTIARNHIIKVSYPTTDMPEDVLSQPNMNDRYIQISIDSGNIYVNVEAEIIVRDEEVENGVVHVLDKVLQQSNAMFVDLLKQDSRISLFCEALDLTGFGDMLVDYMDPEFDKLRRDDGLAGFNDRRTEDNKNLICPVLYPMNRKLGYTGFIETNETFANAGIDTTSIDGLIAYAKDIYEESFSNDIGTYKEDEYTNPNHPLYRFVAYHFLDRQIYTDKMTTYFHFQQNSYDAVDFYETMCKGTIVKVARGGKTQGQTRLNRRHGLSHGKSYTIEGVPVQSMKHDGINGVYYLIDEPLVYSTAVINDVLIDRMRFDASTLMPELATNNIFRNGNGDTDSPSRGHSYQIPNTMEYSYVKNLKVYQESIVYYQAPVIGFWCWYADEIIAKGSYDFAIKLPPVPKESTYEIRYGYVPMGHRGVVQVYLEYDGKSYPCGIPIDLTEDGTSPKIGWVSDKDKTEDELLKLDKAMHNRGYLKGPLTQTEGSQKSNIARDQSNHLRRIVATMDLKPGTDYYIRFRSVDETAKEFMFDYLELCPKEVYDNPLVQEDRL
jgi:uncharacterized surface protein with fasciclin (FAS1) repeats